jgi:plasmid stabilization system protein ParE
VTGFYWERHPDGPFATLIGVTETYCSPDAAAADYERLKRLAKREDDQQMRVFKAELRQALADPGQLPEGELDDAVEYNDESDEKFLRRLWRDLYGDEPAADP